MSRKMDMKFAPHATRQDKIDYVVALYEAYAAKDEEQYPDNPMMGICRDSTYSRDRSILDRVQDLLSAIMNIR